jgi:broad specificity phosphatase PhoE
MALEFIFVRHGESVANRDGFIAEEDTPLSDTGREQARLTGQALKDAGIKAIVCSPAARAFETAKIIAGELYYGVEDIQVLDELRERKQGELIGKPKDHPSEWYFALQNEHGVEPYDTLFVRMQLALEKIRKAAEQDGLVLVVGHAISGFVLTQIAAGKKSAQELDPPTVFDNAGYLRMQIP